MPPQLTGVHLSQKVLKYETFLNEQLKPDLKALLEERDKVYSETAEFLALKNSIEAIQQSDLRPQEPLKTKVDLGCNFYAEARVPDPSRVFVEVGLGFFLELTLAEALTFVGKRTTDLEAKAAALTDRVCQVKANIKLTLQGLRELQNLSDDDLIEKKNRRRADLL